MNLFEMKIDGDKTNLTFSPQALALKPFNDIWKRNKSKDKAFKELSYVYFMVDWNSDFMITLDEDERSKEILSSMELPKNWKPDGVIQSAIKFYKQRQTTLTSRIYDAARKGLQKMEKYLSDVDLLDTDAHGKSVHNANQYNTILKNLSDTIDSVDKLERKVKGEMENKTSGGNKERSMFDKGI